MRPFRVQRETARKCVDENNRTFNIGSDQNIYFFNTVECTNNKAASNCGGASNSLSVVYPAYQDYYCQSHYMQTVERRLSKL